VAISHGINANVIRKWLPLYRDQPPAALPAFVPLMATPKRPTDQGSLLDDLLDTDIAAIEAELKAVNPPVAPAEPRQQPRRTPL
ncbi:hypothetical protein, partial [Metapseudomonas resinovorans]|uniref:hypothetical protein n=1 Tax=Metapseudomonas resinovorans TaxID=53412 RepID=UPI002556373A